VTIGEDRPLTIVEGVATALLSAEDIIEARVVGADLALDDMTEIEIAIIDHLVEVAIIVTEAEAPEPSIEDVILMVMIGIDEIVAIANLDLHEDPLVKNTVEKTEIVDLAVMKAPEIEVLTTVE